jgi:uncharacterized protein
MHAPLEFPTQSFADGKVHELVVTVEPEEVALEWLAEDVRVASPINIRMQARRQQKDVDVVLDVRTTAVLACGRCLDPVHRPLVSQFRVFYRPAAARPDHLPDEEEAGLGYYEAGIIDIREDVRRYLLLEVPFWPLCRDDCLGLCHHCGTNQNHGTCACESKKDRGVREGALVVRLQRLLG